MKEGNLKQWTEHLLLLSGEALASYVQSPGFDLQQCELKTKTKQKGKGENEQTILNLFLAAVIYELVSQVSQLLLLT